MLDHFDHLRRSRSDILAGLLSFESQGIADFRVPPPITKFIDASEAIDELHSYNSFEPAPDDF